MPSPQIWLQQCQHYWAGHTESSSVCDVCAGASVHFNIDDVPSQNIAQHEELDPKLLPLWWNVLLKSKPGFPKQQWLINAQVPLRNKHLPKSSHQRGENTSNFIILFRGSLRFAVALSGKWRAISRSWKWSREKRVEKNRVCVTGSVVQ